MTLHELDKLLHEQWMSMSEEERFLTCGRLYEAEKAILERAPRAGGVFARRSNGICFLSHARSSNARRSASAVRPTRPKLIR